MFPESRKKLTNNTNYLQIDKKILLQCKNKYIFNEIKNLYSWFEKKKIHTSYII